MSPISTNSPLSVRQAQILEFVRQHYAQHGVPPGIREICAQVCLSSSSTVHSHLQSLVAKRYLVPRKVHGMTAYYPMEAPKPAETQEARDRDAFLRGFLCCVAAMINAHGSNNGILDVLGCTREQAIAAGIDSGDLETIERAEAWPK